MMAMEGGSSSSSSSSSSSRSSSAHRDAAGGAAGSLRRAAAAARAALRAQAVYYCGLRQLRKRWLIVPPARLAALGDVSLEATPLAAGDPLAVDVSHFTAGSQWCPVAGWCVPLTRSLARSRLAY